MKRSCLALAVAAVISMPFTAVGSEGSEPAFGTKLVDIVIVRPVTIVGSIASTAFAIGCRPLPG